MTDTDSQIAALQSQRALLLKQAREPQAPPISEVNAAIADLDDQIAALQQTESS